MIKVYVDGGVKNATMYIGIYSESKKLNIKVNKKLGIGFIHNAEETALYTCLLLLKELKVQDEVTIFNDNKSLIDSVNATNITNNLLSSYPKLKEIRLLLTSLKNIKVAWIKSNSNLAHPLLSEAYKNNFFNDCNYNLSLYNSINKELTSDDIYTNNKIKCLEYELIKKDLIIEGLLNTKLNLNL